MSNYLTDKLPFPPPRNKEEAQFWQHCRARRLLFRRCTDCADVQHPPMALCPQCQSTEGEWCSAPQTAELYTYTVAHHVVHEDVRANVPYVIAVVLFAGLNNLRFVTNLVGVPHSEITIGMRVSVIWEPLPSGVFLPRFERATQ